MVIQIRLSGRVDLTPEETETDSLGRSWYGYDARVSEEDLWEHNRGRWNLNEDKIAEETFATFVHDGRTVAAYRIDGFERVSDPGPAGTKIALIGRPLAASDPARQALVGRRASHRGRNAINYLPDGTIGDSITKGSGRRAFLLTWNPDKWDWAAFEQCVIDTERGDVIGERWSTGGRTTGIHVGDLVFLLRQGKRGRGIVGSGQATDFSDAAGPGDEIIYSAPHWNGTGALTNYVDVEWDRLVKPDDLLPTEELEEEFAEQNWAPMASGTEVRPELIDRLASTWARHLGEVRTRPDDGQGYVANTAQRKAIEDAAQDWLMQHYRDEGWTVRDTRYSGPYDAIATRNAQTLYLEAKGTQSSGEAVFVTRGEVEHARRHHGDCVIGIWSGMRFTDEGGIDPDAGETIIMPFEPDTGILSALQYRWEWGAAAED